MYKIIGADQKEYGPVSAEEIRQWIAEGRANGQTPVQAVGELDWKPLATIPEFAAALASSPFAAVPQYLSATAGVGSMPTIEEIEARDYEVDIGACVNRAWALMGKNFLPVVGISFVAVLIPGVLNQIISMIYRPAIQAMVQNHEVSVGGIALIMACSLVMAPIQTVFIGGLFNYYIKLIRGENPGLAEVFSGLQNSLGQLLLLSVVMSVLLMFGMFLCLIPGIFLGVCWLFAMPLVVDRQMNFWQAMELSRKVVTRHWFMVFALAIVVGLLKISGVFACCIGIFATVPLGYLALLYAYEDIFGRRSA